MRIAIPTADGKLCVHFGHCNEFAIVDVDCNRKIVLTTTYLTPPPHEPGVLPAWLGEHGTDVIIAGGMGRRAMELFRNSGIEVIIGASGDVPEALATAYLTGTIEIGQNVCDH